MKKYRFLAGFLSLIILFQGCSLPFYTENTEKSIQETPESISEPTEEQADWAKTLVEEYGFLADGVKTIYFLDGETGDQFEIINADTEKKVMEGSILNTAPPKAVFTELKDEGNYYLLYGKEQKSPIFKVAKKIYEEPATNLLQNWEEKWMEGISGEELAELSMSALYLMTVQEMYPMLTLSEMESRKDVSGNDMWEEKPETLLQVLELYLKQVEAVLDEKGVELTAYEKGLLSGIYAKFSYLCIAEGSDYSGKSIQRAVALWKNLNQQKKLAKEDMDAKYFAATELYKASGQKMYYNFILNYSTDPQNQSEDEIGIFGNIAYLTTKRKVDVEYCNVIMSKLTGEAAECATDIKREEALDEKNVPRLLDSLTRIAFADYVLTSYEYSAIIDEKLNYLCGQNIQEENYGKELTESIDIVKLFLLMQSAMGAELSD